MAYLSSNKSLAVLLLFLRYCSANTTDCRNALIEFNRCVENAAFEAEYVVKSHIQKYESQIKQCFLSNGCDSPQNANGTFSEALINGTNDRSGGPEEVMCKANVAMRRQQWMVDCVNRNNHTALLPAAQQQMTTFGKRHYLDPSEIQNQIMLACHKAIHNASIIGSCIFKIFEDHKNESDASFDVPCATRKACQHARDQCMTEIRNTANVRLGCARNWGFLVQNESANLNGSLVKQCKEVKKNVTGSSGKVVAKRAVTAPVSTTKGNTSKAEKGKPLMQNVMKTNLPLWKRGSMDVCGARYFRNEYLLVGEKIDKLIR